MESFHLGTKKAEQSSALFKKSMGNYFFAGALHFSQTLPSAAVLTQQGCWHLSPFLSALSQQPPALNFEDSLVVVAGLTSGEGEAAKATEAQTRAITTREAICFMVGKIWSKSGNSQSDFNNLSGREPARRGAQGDKQ